MPGKHNGRKRARGEDDAPPPGESTTQTDLNNSVQKILKRNLTRGEISYTVQKADLGGGWVATVKTPKMSETFDAQEHSGEVKDTELEAKEHAASAALAAIFADPELLTIHDAPKVLPDRGEKPPPDAPKDKGKFRNAVLKICRISLKKEDIVWETNEVEGGGWQSTLTASCLPGAWKDMNFVGEVCDDQMTAEHSAALVGYNKLMADPEMSALHDRKKAPDSRPGRGSKGKGKGGMSLPGMMGMPGMMQGMNPMMMMGMMTMMANMNPMMMQNMMMGGMGGMGGMGMGGMGEPAAKRQKMMGGMDAMEPIADDEAAE